MKSNPNEFRDTLPPDEVMLEPSGQFAADLRNLRSAVHCAAERSGSESFSATWLIAARRRQRVSQRRLVLAWTCAALLCIGVAVPFLRHSTTAPATPVAKAQPVVIDDTALLEQVDSAVSESVPSSLAPLATLDEWSSTTSTNTASTLNTSEKKNVAQ
jgi:hypothetical protein